MARLWVTSGLICGASESELVWVHKELASAEKATSGSHGLGTSTSRLLLLALEPRRSCHGPDYSSSAAGRSWLSTASCSSPFVA